MLTKQRLKYIQSLSQKKFRQEEKLFIAEGPKILGELLDSSLALIKEIYATSDWIKENTTRLKRVTLAELTNDELKKISQLSTPNKVLAILHYFDHGENIECRNKITLALDRIQDPGNLGTIIRIADWFGVEQLVCSPGSADLYNPKTIQATMGSFIRVRVYYRDLPSWLSSVKDIRIYAAELEGRPVSSFKQMKEGIIVIGNESQGINPEIEKLCNARITIPRKGGAESLNAAIATGIILSHLS